jgi:photosystem II stability/assembly factor-like uncharacterized protein
VKRMVIGIRLAWALLPAMAALSCGSSDDVAGGVGPEPEDAAPDMDVAETSLVLPDVVVEAGAAAGICSRDAWCWELPRPQGNALYAVWANGPEKAWVAGDGGTLLSWDGARFRSYTLPTDARIESVWAAGENAWAAADDGGLYAFDGTAWQVVPLPLADGGDGSMRPALHAVFGTAATDVWAVGDGGLVLHLGPSGWTTPMSGSTAVLRAVYAFDKSNAWAVGDGGVILAYDGATWKVATSNATLPLRSVHGRAADDVWAVGDQGTAVHFDGMAWTRRDLAPAETAVLRAVQVQSTDSVWAFGDGGVAWHWAPVPILAPRADAGRSDAALPDAAAPIDAEAGDGQRERRWMKISSSTDATLRAAWATSGSVVFAVGDRGTVLEWNVDSLSTLSQGSGANRLAVAGTSDGGVWAVGDDIVHRSAGAWSVAARETSRALYGLAVASAEDAWAVGTAGTVLRYQAVDSGKAWVEVDSPTQKWLRSIWLAGTNGGWVVGQSGTTLGLLNGSSWQPIPSGVSVDLMHVWGTIADDVWAVGQGGTIVHWHGGKWTLVPNGADGGTTNELRGVWGSGASDVWAVGAGGTILRYNGSVWSIARTGESYSLNAVWGSGASDVWAVGTGGTIVHYDGAAWAGQESGTRDSLNAVWGDGTDRVWVAGENGAILRRGPE